MSATHSTATVAIATVTGNEIKLLALPEREMEKIGKFLAQQANKNEIV
jgi:hypothetical protein